MVIFFIAGYETTATTLHFMIYNLALYPDIQQKIADEIQQQIGDVSCGKTLQIWLFWNES